MKPSIFVFTEAEAADTPTLAYAAALAKPLGATLRLLHVLSLPAVAELEYDVPLLDAAYLPAVRAALTRAIAGLSVPATVELLEDDWHAGLDQLLATHHPALLVAGLTATTGPLDEWLSNRVLTLAHRTGYPLLLVPEHLPVAAQRPPRRMLLAVEDHPFRLTPPGRALAPVLAKLGCAVLPATVFPPHASAGRGEAARRAVQHCGLSATLAHEELRHILHENPAAGIWQAADELSADWVALLDQGHGWLHKVFSGSVIADVLRYSQVPVLLLPVASE